MVIGDFNEILFYFEKCGGRSRSERLICNFKHTMEDCKLVDVGYNGDLFTLNNKHESNSYTKEMLDRAVANSYWAEAINLVSIESLVAGP